MKINRQILVLSLCLSILTGSCFQFSKDHFSFKRIYDGSFSQQTKFFATYDHIFVIERDKLVCMNPDNGEMLEYVELPGYPVDVHQNLLKGIELSMIFKSSDGFTYRDFIVQDKKPFIKVNRTCKVMGSRILNNKESFLGNDYLLIENMSSHTIFLYSTKDMKLLDTLPIKKEFRFGDVYGVNGFLIYDGSQLVAAGIRKDKFVMPLTTDEWKKHNSWKIPAADFSKSFLKTDSSYIVLYNGAKLYKMDIFVKIGEFEEIDIPQINSVGDFSVEIMLGCVDGMYYLNIYKDLVKVTDHAYDVIDGTVGEILGNDYSLAGKLIGKNYHLIGFRKSMFDMRDKDKSKQIAPPSTITFDLLPEGTFCVGLVKIKDSACVYAFTSEGLYRSEELFFDQSNHDMLEKVKQDN